MGGLFNDNCCDNSYSRNNCLSTSNNDNWIWIIIAIVVIWLLCFNNNDGCTNNGCC